MADAKPYQTVGVLGAGAWGTALSALAARLNRRVTLWAREAEVVQDIETTRRNSRFLPGIELPAGISATQDMAALGSCDCLLAVTPAQFMRATLTSLAPSLKKGTPIVLCTKGIERDTGRFMIEILDDVAPGMAQAVLSGPSFAADAARGLPIAVTLACADVALGERLAVTLGSTSFRTYLSEDLIGAEIGGAVKNVLAIACGVAEGRGYGESARAALITRGFVEMTRFGLALGAKAETMAGLCGLGDLILTCSSQTSRNYALGRALGQGKSLAEILKDKLSVAEGMETAPALMKRARAAKVEMPICEAAAAILSGELGVNEAVHALLARPYRSEW